MPAAPTANPKTCAHDRLLARFRNRAAQLANQPMGYKCQSCLAEFLPADPVAQRFVASRAAESAQAAGAPAAE